MPQDYRKLLRRLSRPAPRSEEERVQRLEHEREYRAIQDAREERSWTELLRRFERDRPVSQP